MTNHRRVHRARCCAASRADTASSARRPALTHSSHMRRRLNWTSQARRPPEACMSHMHPSC